MLLRIEKFRNFFLPSFLPSNRMSVLVRFPSIHNRHGILFNFIAFHLVLLFLIFIHTNLFSRQVLTTNVLAHTYTRAPLTFFTKRTCTRYIILNNTTILNRNEKFFTLRIKFYFLYTLIVSARARPPFFLT